MFTLLKIFNFITFPPSIFIIILIASLYYINKNSKRTVFLILADIVLLYSLSIEPVKNLILSPLESYASPINMNQEQRADYIVILGGGIINSSPEENGAGSLASDSMKRALYGVYLAEKLKTPVIFSGGITSEHQTESEADIALRVLKRYAGEEVKLEKEDQSRTTFENAEFIKNKFSPEKIILVTSAYHMKRSLYAFKRAGIICIAAPTDYKINGKYYNATSFIPKTGEMDDIYKGLKEYAGLIFYYLK